MESNPILQAALAYAAQGLAIFPAPPGTKQSHKSAKHSDGRAWGATCDPEEIRRDFTRWPDAGIGIPTGAINSVVVVETDTVEGHGVDGSAALAQLEAEHGPLPDTLQAISPTGSAHRYFKHPSNGIKIKSSASEIGAGIDVRGDGGMVLAPPTVRPGIGTYRWLNRNPIAPMPAWLVDLTREKPRTISQRAVTAINKPTDGANGYGTAALTDEIAQLACTTPGRRNDQLNRASFSLYQLVGGGELNAGEVEQALYWAATANGLIANDGAAAVLRTIESGRRAGLQCPRSRSPRS